MAEEKTQISFLEEKQLALNVNYGKCPACGVSHAWTWYWMTNPLYMYQAINAASSTLCGHCGQLVIFLNNGTMIYPRISTHVKPHELLNRYPKVKKLFEESLAVAGDSPRAGLALSRMCLECLTREILTENGKAPGDNFSANTQTLLDLEIITKKVKSYLDDSRVIGNKSVHNFNIIDTENEVTFDDCLTVWKAVNHILDSLKTSQELNKDLSSLKNKVQNQ